MSYSVGAFRNGPAIVGKPVKSIKRKHDIINHMFGLKFNDKDFQPFSSGIDVYFNDWWDVHFQQCQRQVSVRSEEELLNIIPYLRDPQATRQSIHSAMRAAGHSSLVAEDSDLDASIVLAARLFLMLSIGVIRLSIPPGRSVPWSDSCIRDAIRSEFKPTRNFFQPERISKSFTAVNLEIIAGIKICWTSNLADHLLMKEDESSVMLFHHVSMLQLHQVSKWHVIEPDLIEDTLSTLALLLPSNEPRSKKWFARKVRRFRLDPLAGARRGLLPRTRRIENFTYWRDRLIILKQAFDDSEPSTVLQWWHDDRKKVQWYTFWTAALVLFLTVVFGIVQTVSGVIQAWASIKSLP